MDSLRSKGERVFACAMPFEHRAAKRHGPAILVGIACELILPSVPVVSFGVAGGLSNLLPAATRVDARKVVDEEGRALWEGRPLGIPGAYVGVVLGANRIINSVEERARLCKQSGADIVDMESGIYARRGLLRGCIRVVSDTPAYRLGTARGLRSGVKALWSLYRLTF